MAERFGDWIQTYTGGRIYPLDAREDEVDIKDIAHSLALQCRYNGHCVDFYSVAEHSVILSHLVDPEYALDALLHDASEAYLTDIPRPIKPFLQGYYEYEDKLMQVIAKKFNFTWPMPKQVKEFDTRILNDERVENMNVSEFKWADYGEPLEVGMYFWGPEEAERQFLKRFYELTNKTTEIGV